MVSVGSPIRSFTTSLLSSVCSAVLLFELPYLIGLTSCFGLMTDSAVVDSALVGAALYQIDVPALSYIYAAYGKSGLISNGKE